MSTTITNYDGGIVTTPQQHVHPRTVQELQDILRDRQKYPSPVRAMGSNHSLTPCAASTGTVVSMDGFTKIVRIDTAKKTLTALNPDVALIHVQRADSYGNAQIDGLQFMDIDIAMAANRVILTTERLISNDQIRRTPDRTRIPFFTVDAVVEVPYGSAPHECYGLYEPFFGHMD